ncbi:heme oxygenase 1, chloroplastic-like [Olea europaea var. sylvestris]|uniref:heme oxygenase 1, chloroplastic-like n=1 Tax=Olea europaea var. sylvestris TaxID=158386 RepID=UPI000C1CEA55|nr:heme oxygenase 1, chloroplastic-like [Olea europaea var. sylvestris]
MASVTIISHYRLPLFMKPQFTILNKPNAQFLPMPISRFTETKPKMVVVSATGDAQKSKKRYPREAKGFVDEMRLAAMKLHTREQAKEGESKETVGLPMGEWEPTLEGYLKFLVDSRLVYDTMEKIMDKATFSEYAELKNTGLERTKGLTKDLEWFKLQGHAIPQPSSLGVSYAQYMEELSRKDPQALICHFYTRYFGHAAGGRLMGTKVAKTILNNQELEFYKWDGDLSQLLQNVREKLNRVAETWTEEEKNHCLDETEKSFKFSGDIMRLILS